MSYVVGSSLNGPRDARSHGIHQGAGIDDPAHLQDRSRGSGLRDTREVLRRKQRHPLLKLGNAATSKRQLIHQHLAVELVETREIPGS